SIGLLFGRAIETYVLLLTIVKDAYLNAKANKSMTKLSNCLDDILELTDKGRRQATQIQQGLASDFCVWYWRFSVQLCIKGQHIPTNVSIQYEGTIIYLNLKRSIRDQVILSWRANSCTAKKVKLKLLALFNSVSKEQLEMEEKYRTN
ncbi:3255_t:CDS:2, partial [Gigaspora rosea]